MGRSVGPKQIPKLYGSIIFSSLYSDKLKKKNIRGVNKCHGVYTFFKKKFSHLNFDLLEERTYWLRNANKYLMTINTARGRLESNSFNLSTHAWLSSIPNPANVLKYFMHFTEDCNR